MTTLCLLCRRRLLQHPLSIRAALRIMRLVATPNCLRYKRGNTPFYKLYHDSLLFVRPFLLRSNIPLVTASYLPIKVACSYAWYFSLRVNDFSIALFIHICGFLPSPILQLLDLQYWKTLLIDWYCGRACVAALSRRVGLSIVVVSFETLDSF